MFVPVSQCWPSSNREIKQEDHSTQTPGSPAVRLNGMLPCGVAEEPRRLFYGSAGLLLLTPSARTDRVEDAMFPENRPRRRPAHSVEAQIGQKLQMIGDQFYQEHMLQHQNQRNQWPFWLRLASALYALLFDGEPAVHRRRQEDRRWVDHRHKIRLFRLMALFNFQHGFLGGRKREGRRSPWDGDLFYSSQEDAMVFMRLFSYKTYWGILYNIFCLWISLALPCVYFFCEQLPSWECLIISSHCRKTVEFWMWTEVETVVVVVVLEVSFFLLLLSSRTPISLTNLQRVLHLSLLL